MSLARPGWANGATIQSGDIVASHNGGTNNQPPTAQFSYTVNALEVNFTDGSSDSGGQIVSWHWDFGDGQSDTSQNPQHTYAAPGSYDVTLTVLDNDGATDSMTITVVVAADVVAPIVTIEQGSNNSTDITLSWTTNPVNCSYEIYHDNLPYFTPDSSNFMAEVLGTTTTLTVPDVRVNAGENHYFIVRSIGCGTTAYADSWYVGVFNFLIVPGE
jgi:PKD repeat protein